MNTGELKEIRERLHQIRLADRTWKMQLKTGNGNVHNPDTITILSSNGYITYGDLHAFTQFAADVDRLLAMIDEMTRPYNEAERRTLDADFARSVYSGDTDPADLDQNKPTGNDWLDVYNHKG